LDNLFFLSVKEKNGTFQLIPDSASSRLLEGPHFYLNIPAKKSGNIKLTICSCPPEEKMEEWRIFIT
jgi:hypothetical protein